ncbi:hypothetical protein HL736_001193 [Campylobacter lari]|uniref:hypothetical protein n=1 Tax=Campylobacter volucris TaxID=1031542 RepID=UPI00189C6439|nr:hypothetical protein [Campylobacter volucris]EFO9318186.1 hypothetical protein [Campylobacter lari]MBF7048134.1 hypothetical protein [Campylobacter volucris]
MKKIILEKLEKKVLNLLNFKDEKFLSFVKQNAFYYKFLKEFILGLTILAILLLLMLLHMLSILKQSLDIVLIFMFCIDFLLLNSRFNALKEIYTIYQTYELKNKFY